MSASVVHKYVACIRAETDVQYAMRGRRRTRYDDFHIQQSELDGACGLVTVLQCAMALGGIRRKEVEEIASAKSGPLRALWTLARRDYFTGTTEQELERMVAVFSPMLTCKVVKSSRRDTLGREIVRAIDAGHIPILGLHSRTFRHWTLIVGYERYANKTRPLALLSLDASDSRPHWGVFYNARCAMTPSAFAGKSRKPKKYCLRYASTDGETHLVRLQGLVIVKRGQPP
ncbi:hypothetical protein [Rhodoferax sp. GW822-FHT02A01]|uniref:hypothetical protein n=1 Tax=Rhodoferax sp. GW822-FHT02A01 TaxID=3141537 RepID=UPI00315CE531